MIVLTLNKEQIISLLIVITLLVILSFMLGYWEGWNIGNVSQTEFYNTLYRDCFCPDLI